MFECFEGIWKSLEVLGGFLDCSGFDSFLRAWNALTIFQCVFNMFEGFESCWRLLKMLWSLDLLRFVSCFVTDAWFLACCFLISLQVLKCWIPSGLFKVLGCGG